MSVEVSVAVKYPTGHTTLLKRTSLASIQRRNNVVCRWGCPQGLFSGVKIQLKFSLAQCEIQLALTIFYYIFVKKIH